MSDYEAIRASNILRNRALVAELGLKRLRSPSPKHSARTQPPHKRTRVEDEVVRRPTRNSARLELRGIRLASSAAMEKKSAAEGKRKQRNREGNVIRPRRPAVAKPASREEDDEEDVKQEDSSDRSDVYSDVDALRASWTAWTRSAPAPILEAKSGTYYFDSHPSFSPNVSPADMLRLGVFGGSYFRPLYSHVLKTTVQDDWRELPSSWTSGLDVQRYLTNPTYDPSANKYGVKCGQSIEEWEASGWIAHEYDVRGWFQWYCRFWMGRRCEDDERQVGRWRRCVGENGRWRRALLRKYVAVGIREVWDDGEGEGVGDVSPVVHQTCLQWGWEVRQGELERFWKERR